MAMIEITRTVETEFPNAFAKARGKKPWVSRIAVARYRVVPRTNEHGKYIVTFRMFGKGVWADCFNLIANEECKSEKGTRLCYHRAAALIHCQKLAERKVA